MSSIPLCVLSSKYQFLLFFSPSVPLFSLCLSISLSSWFSSSVSPAVNAVHFLTCYVCVCLHQNRLHLKESHFVFKPWGDVCPSTKGEMSKPCDQAQVNRQAEAEFHLNKSVKPTWIHLFTNTHFQPLTRTTSREINKLKSQLAPSPCRQRCRRR